MLRFVTHVFFLSRGGHGWGLICRKSDEHKRFNEKNDGNQSRNQDM